MKMNKNTYNTYNNEKLHKKQKQKAATSDKLRLINGI